MGMAYRMALLDDIMLWSNNTEIIESMLDSYEDNVDSLADVAGYKELSETLQEYNVFYGFFSAASYSLSHIKEGYVEFSEEHQFSDATKAIDEAIVAELEKAVLLKPFEALASGVGLDENGYYLVIALVNASDEIAVQNASLLEQRRKQLQEQASVNPRWSRLTDGYQEIHTTGNITVAKIYGSAYQLWNFSAMDQTPMWGFATNAFIVTE
jgi:hypothetical protein